MTHPLVDQLRFARAQFRRGLAGLTEEEAARRFQPMNCISWNIGHLAWQEQRYWLWRAQGLMPRPDVQELFSVGAPASTPSLAFVWEAWEEITRPADLWLDQVDTALLTTPAYDAGKPLGASFGSLVLRHIHHYWYHNGENMAIRQLLGHTDLPVFVGTMDGPAAYRPE